MRTPLAAAAASLAVASPCAAFTTYGTRAEWASAVGAFDVEEFESTPLQNTLPLCSVRDLSESCADEITIDAPTLDIVIPVGSHAAGFDGIFANGQVNGTREFVADLHWTPLYPGHAYYNTIVFDQPIVAFAVDLARVTDTCFDCRGEMSPRTGPVPFPMTVSILGEGFAVAYGAGFFGVSSPTPFSSLVFGQTTPVWGFRMEPRLDDISFVPVPEPSAAALLAIGLALLGCSRSRYVSAMATVRRFLSLTVMPAGLCLLAQAAVAAVSPNGNQFQVNTYTAQLQSFPSAAMDAVGNSVVVWASEVNAGGDTSPWSIQAQRYDASGAPVGGEFQVNTYTASSQINPSVASDAAGNFVVVWHSFGGAGSDTAGFSIQGQRYGASGIPVGGEFQVNSHTTGDQEFPAVARNAAGDFVVAWESNTSAGSDASGWSVHGRLYDASGAPIGGEFQANTSTAGYQQNAAVAIDSSRNVVVVWDSAVSAGTDDLNSSIQGQRYAASGAPIGGEFQVNTWTTNSQIDPSVASDSAGNFVVVWQSSTSAESDNVSIQGQRYAANGSPVGTQFAISTDATVHHGGPSVTSDPSGNFVVAWHRWTSPGFTTSEVLARAYRADGSALGPPFQVNTYTTSAQHTSSVASGSQGDFVVAFQSWGSPGSDQSWFSIQGQRYLPEPSFVSGLGSTLALLLALARGRSSSSRTAESSRSRRAIR